MSWMVIALVCGDARSGRREVMFGTRRDPRNAVAPSASVLTGRREV
jgi:hypothetical protein